MMLFLSIALLIIGSAATFAAFGGRTWEEGNQSIVARITTRGWVCLVCWILALSIGVCKELYSSNLEAKKDAQAALAAKQAKIDSDAKLADLRNRLTAEQGQLELANARLELSNAKLEALSREDEMTQDQITGGNGFPVAFILAALPDNGAFPLRAIVHGKAPLFEVSYRVMVGAYKRPAPDELPKIAQEAIDQANGHGENPAHYLGTLDTGESVLVGYTIRPAMMGINTYRIFFDARNGAVLETLEVRFNTSLNIWQYREEIRSQSTKTPNKLLLKEDWEPKQRWPMLFGEGPP